MYVGTFKRLLPLAASRSLRIICPNRRDYPGTTPFSPAELKILSSGTEEERTKFMEQMGLDFASFVYALIKQCDLPKDITISGWSLGNIVLTSLISNVNIFSDDIRETLLSSIKGVLMWDPPMSVFGMPLPPDGYSPLLDMSLSYEDRVTTFGTWVASYFKHGDLSTRDIGQLNFRDPDRSKKPSTENMGEELSSVVDFTVASRSEIFFSAAREALEVNARQADKAIFDLTIREAWCNLNRPFTILYCNAGIWSIIYPTWALQDKVESARTAKPLLHFEVFEGVNHFVMWDEPETALDKLQACINSSV